MKRLILLTILAFTTRIELHACSQQDADAFALQLTGYQEKFEYFEDKFAHICQDAYNITRSADMKKYQSVYYTKFMTEADPKTNRSTLESFSLVLLEITDYLREKDTLIDRYEALTAISKRSEIIEEINRELTKLLETEDLAGVCLPIPLDQGAAPSNKSAPPHLNEAGQPFSTEIRSGLESKDDLVRSEIEEFFQEEAKRVAAFPMPGNKEAKFSAQYLEAECVLKFTEFERKYMDICSSFYGIELPNYYNGITAHVTRMEFASLEGHQDAIAAFNELQFNIEDYLPNASHNSATLDSIGDLYFVVQNTVSLILKHLAAMDEEQQIMLAIAASMQSEGAGAPPMPGEE